MSEYNPLTDYVTVDEQVKAAMAQGWQPPLTPYAGTSGWKGSDASYERAVEEDANGNTSRRQRISLYRVMTQGERGLTWKELSEIENWHAGQCSSSLSILHKEGYIYRLKEKRNRCSIYVTEANINEREISMRKVRDTCKHCGGEL
jgi:hypothetical protein